MIVHKYKTTRNGLARRRISYDGKNLIVSSLTRKKYIVVDDIISCKTIGKKMTIVTTKYGVVSLKIPRISDALAFSNVMG
ncbi:unnamed protein product [Pylaiella littoralis]